MTRLFAAAALALLASIVAVPSAFAQCAVGVGVGGSLAKASLDVTGMPLGIDGAGLHSTRPDLALHADCGIRLAHTPVVAGLWVDHVWQDVAFSATLGSSSFKAAIGDATSVGGKVGYRLDSGVTPYVVAGYTWADLNWSLSSPVLPGSLKGWTYGGGVTVPLSKDFAFEAESRWTRFDSASIGGMANLNVDQLSVMGRLKWNFSGLFQPDQPGQSGK